MRRAAWSFKYCRAHRRRRPTPPVQRLRQHDLSRSNQQGANEHDAVSDQNRYSSANVILAAFFDRRGDGRFRADRHGPVLHLSALPAVTGRLTLYAAVGCADRSIRTWTDCVAYAGISCVGRLYYSNGRPSNNLGSNAISRPSLGRRRRHIPWGSCFNRLDDCR
jgi:hypothetical protein